MISLDLLVFALSRASQESVCFNFGFAEDDVELIVVTVVGVQAMED